MMESTYCQLFSRRRGGLELRAAVLWGTAQMSKWCQLCYALAVDLEESCTSLSFKSLLGMEHCSLAYQVT